MRLILALLVTLPGMAAAHPGHLTELGGHSHWIAAGAIGLAVAVGLWTKLKDRNRGDEAAESDADAEEAEA